MVNKYYSKQMPRFEIARKKVINKSDLFYNSV